MTLGTRKSVLSLSAVGMVIALVVAACGGGEKPTATAAPTALAPTATAAPTAVAPTPTPAPTAAPPTPAPVTPKRGGTIHILHQQEGITFDATNTGVFQTYYLLGSFVWNQLLRFDNKQWTDSTVVSDVAVKWEASADAKQFVVTLDPNARWQNIPPVNGRRLTAGDIKWFFDWLQSPAYKGGNKVPLQDVASIEARDDQTVVFNLKGPFIGLPSALSFYTMKLLPREQLEQDGDFSKRAVGSGPWIFKNWERGTRWTFERNPNYWKLGADGKALPYIDSVEVLIVPDESTDLALMRSGQLDVFAPNALQPQIAKPLIRDNAPFDWIVDFKLFADEVHGNNSLEPWKSNKKLRQALMMSIDQDAIAKNVIFEDDAPLEGPITAGMGKFSLSQDELKRFLRYDPVEASKILTELGYSASNPLKLEVSFLLPGAPGSQTERYAQILGPLISKTPGFQATVYVPPSPAEGFGRIFGNKYQVGKTFVGFEGDIYNWFRNFYFTGGPRNWFSLSDPTLDAMIQDFLRTLDSAALVQKAQDMQRYILDQAYVVPLVGGRWYLPQQKWVKNFKRTWGWGFTGIEFAWLQR